MGIEANEPICAILTLEISEQAPDGQWRLFLGHDDESVFPICVGWDFARMPSLMERYDALRYMGFAVCEGGPEAWKWQEGALPNGSAGLLGVTEIRPLTAAEEQARPVGTSSLH
ncbi:DUF6303 family protein [Streptomyces indiaensis]|uniref:Uncharacterized protein n=1 Tax=Streptomyces indiaensis TaxID=284033 RepID=A0ABP5PZQ6_9ACTN|nr:DUF6303 family protein [Streptomyces indiaensis]MCF1645479.1 DUF6303 family protein [Streptomyces indiaensis]